MYTQTGFQLAANYTQQSHYDALKAGLIAAGWGNPIDEYTSGTTKNMVFKPLTTGTYAARLHLRVEISSANFISFYTADGWDVATHSTQKEASGGTVGSYNSTAQVLDYLILTGANGYVISAHQGSARGAGGALLVDLTMTEWDTALFLPFLTWGGSGQLQMPSGSAKNPWGSTTSATFRADVSTLGLAVVNTLNNLRELVVGLALANNLALLGYLPDDFGRVVSQNAAFWDTYTVDGTSETWLSLDGSSTATYCLRIG